MKKGWFLVFVGEKRKLNVYIPMFINEIVSVYSFIPQTFIINVYYVPGSSQEEEKG